LRAKKQALDAQQRLKNVEARLKLL